MKIYNTVKNIIGWGCFFFTCLVFFMYLIEILVPMDERAVLSVWTLLKLLLFSFALAGANRLFTVDRLNSALRLLLHFAVTTAVFYVCFIVWSGFFKNGVMTLIAIVLYAILYTVAMLLAFAFGLFRKKKTSEKKGYSAQFKIEK